MSHHIRVIFRADASIQMGSGHVMRCLTLADMLREHGAEAVFVCREHPGNLFALIEAKGHQLVRLPAPMASTLGRLAHPHWLGATQEEDACQTLEALKNVGGCDWLVVDHYALDMAWEAAMRAGAHSIMVIDDLADREHDCDVLLDQNYHLDMKSRYGKLVPPHCKKLLGPKYALLRPEFRKARNNLRVRNGGVDRIFISFGGSDPANETGKALRAIKFVGKEDVAVDVVAGEANPHQEEIAGLCAKLPRAKLHRKASNMAELMLNADLAIGGGGGMMWERCCLGLPAVVTSVANNQRAGCEAMARAGEILYLGEAGAVGLEVLKAALHVAFSSPWLLMSMGEAGTSLVDGQGSKRVVRQLMVPSIVLRKARMADCEAIFNWRNAEETRKYSVSANLITLDEHVTWFQAALKDTDRQILIGETNREPVGVLRYDRSGMCAMVSVYLVPGNYGKGIGVQLIEQGTLWVEQNWPDVDVIEAVILNGNSPSLTAFSDAGFEKKSCTYTRQIKG